MLEILMVNVMLQFFRFNLTANQTPWNTTCTGNLCTFQNMPSMITINMPWFFPLITLVLLLAADYELGLKKGVDTKTNFFGVALGFTILSYVEVVGSLSTSGYFFVFEFIMIISLFIMTLFTQQPQG